MSAALDLSTRKIKIYASAFDALARADIDAHEADLANPHAVTKAQVGLALVDNTSDVGKPVSTAQAAALALKAPVASPALTGTPTAPTAPAGTATTQLATTAFAHAAANDVASDLGALDAELAAHVANLANPHAVTKAQLGLALVDNTADAAKPVSGPQQTAINAANATATAAQADIDGHQAATNNPHAVTKTQIGLGAVDNTADAAKPVSTAQQTAINAVAGTASAAQADIDGHQANLANPHAVTKAQVGLGSVDNTADAAKPVSGPQQTAINVAGTAASAAQADIDGHQAATNNPHAVTKAQLGLALVDNTADAAKPVSGPQQTAINAVSATATATQADIDGHQANLANPHAVTKAQVGLALVDNTSDAAKPVSTAQQAAINVAGTAASAAQADIDGHQAAINNPHAVTKAQVGLAAVDNTADLAKPVSTATQTALNLKAPLASPALTGTPTAPTAPAGTNSTRLATTAYADAAIAIVQTDIDGHQADLANPHAVTKAQIGLALVDNTSDAAKPVSTATQAALNLKAPLASPALTGTPTAPTAPAGTATTQVATTAYADAAVAIVQADATEALANVAQIPSLVANVPHRPGDAVELYGESKVGSPAAVTLLDPAFAVVSSEGLVVRVANAAKTIAPAAAYSLAPGRVYEVRWRVRRQINPIDPLNDSVTLGLAWLTNAKASNAATIVENIALVAADGVQERIALIGIAPIATVSLDHTAPAGTIYCRPYVDLFGNSHTTDVITIGFEDVTTAFEPQRIPVNMQTPASGATMALADLRPCFVNAGALAALTIRLPPGPRSGDLVELGFLGIVTALSVQTSAGTAIATAPTSAYGPGAAIQMRYISDAFGWVLWK